MTDSSSTPAACVASVAGTSGSPSSTIVTGPVESGGSSAPAATPGSGTGNGGAEAHDQVGSPATGPAASGGSPTGIGAPSRIVLEGANSPYLAVGKQLIRDSVHQILSLWVKRWPNEVAAFARSTAAYRKWIASEGVGTIARRTEWCPSLKVPVRIERALAVHFGKPGEPCDWMRDPVILDIFIDELAEVKLVRNPNTKIL